MSNGRAYYNEIDPYCAQWLRNLIAAGHIADGDVDERSIVDVRPCELRGFTQIHLFAGIGVWSHSLRIAGFPDSRPVLTCSCPCQPFSSAGKGAGFADERHLWPAAFHIIRELRPATIFGEQVEAAIRHDWIDLVQTDMETEGYAFGHTVFGAHSVGAPHIRPRVFWMADAAAERYELGNRSESAAKRWSGSRTAVVRQGGPDNLADPDGDRFARRPQSHERTAQPEQQAPRWDNAGRCSGMGDADCSREEEKRAVPGQQDAIAPRSFWGDAEWIFCRDGKYRPVEPGTFPLAHGIANRVGRLRAYGNAINAQAAAEFIRAYLDTERGGVAA